VSCSYGTLLEHLISARIEKWLPTNRGTTSTRQRVCAPGYGDHLYRHSLCRISRYELPRCLAAERSRKVEALGQIASHDRRAVHLLVVLHPFSGHRETQRVRKVHDQAHDSVVRRIFPQTVDK
jgi:hypothetical protein